MAFRTKPDMSAVWASLGDNTKPLDSYITNGWEAVRPPRQYFNWLDNRQDSAIAYIYQAGVVEWDALTDYEGGAGVASYAQGSDGKVYKCLADNGPNVSGVGTKDPVSQPANAAFWEEAFGSKAASDTNAADIAALRADYEVGAAITDPAAFRTAISAVSSASELLQVAQGFVNTTTTTPAVDYQAGVSTSVVRDALGRYTLTFASAFDNTGGTVKMIPHFNAFSITGTEGQAIKIVAVTTTTVSIHINRVDTGALVDPSDGFFYSVSGKLA